MDRPPLALADDLKHVRLSDVELAVVTARARLVLLNAAEHVHLTCRIPRWAALASLQPALCAGLAGGADLLQRPEQFRRLITASADLATVDIDNAAAVARNGTEAQAALKSYLLGGMN